MESGKYPFLFSMICCDCNALLEGFVLFGFHEILGKGKENFTCHETFPLHKKGSEEFC